MIYRKSYDLQKMKIQTYSRHFSLTSRFWRAWRKSANHCRKRWAKCNLKH